MSKDITVIAVFIIIVALAFVLGFTFGVNLTRKESLAGFRAVPTYSTNDVGEVSLTRIYWKK